MKDRRSMCCELMHVLDLIEAFEDWRERHQASEQQILKYMDLYNRKRWLIENMPDSPSVKKARQRRAAAERRLQRRQAAERRAQRRREAGLKGIQTYWSSPLGPEMPDYPTLEEISEAIQERCGEVDLQNLISQGRSEMEEFLSWQDVPALC